jgi:hypothetical protein
MVGSEENNDKCCWCGAGNGNESVRICAETPSSKGVKVLCD